MINLHCLRTIDDFKAKKSEWDLFMNVHFTNAYYLNHDWLARWWKTYAVDGSVFIFFAYRNKELIGVVPLVIKRETFGGFPATILSFLGSGFGQEDFPIIDKKQEIVRNVFSSLSRQISWNIADFKRLTEESSKIINEVSESLEFSLDVIDTFNPVIRLEGEYSDYFNSRSQSFRANFRKKMKRVNSWGNMEIRVDGSGHITQMKEKIEAIAKQSWQGEKNVHMAVKDKGRNFLNELIVNFIEEKILDITFIYLNNEPIAYLFGAKKNDTFFAIETAYKQKYFDVSPGMLLHLAVLERLYLENKEITIMDLGYDAPYKRRWTAVNRPERQLTIYNKKLYPKLIYRFRKTSLYSKLLTLKK